MSIINSMGPGFDSVGPPRVPFNKGIHGHRMAVLGAF